MKQKRKNWAVYRCGSNDQGWLCKNIVRKNSQNSLINNRARKEASK